MPPKSSVAAEWRVPGFGALEAKDGGANGAKAAGSGVKAAQKPTQKIVQKAAAKSSSKSENGQEAAARVPFGRGPKDKAFARERQEKREKRGKR